MLNKKITLESLDFQIAENSVVREYYDSWAEMNWNLHNKKPGVIQGDERDVVIVSTVYGPNEQGNVKQDFGPINRYYGPRRPTFCLVGQRKNLY